MKDDERFRIDHGEGDKEFFSEPIVLKRAEAPWFAGKVGDWYGDGILCLIDGGKHHGEFVALTPRATGVLQEQIARFGWASVIVHKITNPSSSFKGTEKDVVSVGMALLEFGASSALHCVDRTRKRVVGQVVIP